MTTIGTSDSLYSGRYRLRDQEAVVAATGPTPALMPASAGGSNTAAPAMPNIESGVSPALSLSAALWDMDSGETVRTTVSGKQVEDRNGALAAEFGDLANMSVAERIRAQYLEEKNLTEADLAAMPENERKAIEKEIRARINRALGIDDTDGIANAYKSAPDPAAPASGTEV
jgi:hypothetical protein